MRFLNIKQAKAMKCKPVRWSAIARNPSPNAEILRPRRSSFDEPALWQQHKTALRSIQLNHVQLNVFISRIRFCLITGISLIHIGQLDLLVRDFLNLLEQHADLRAVLLVGRRNV